jgi:hypothetical protein
MRPVTASAQVMTLPAATARKVVALAFGPLTCPFESDPQQRTIPSGESAQMWLDPAATDCSAGASVQVPFEHDSPLVHGLPSSQAVPAATWRARQRPAASHVSGPGQVVTPELPQAVPSGAGANEQAPDEGVHVSSEHASPSSQTDPKCEQPAAGSQWSALQTSPSAQSPGPYAVCTAFGPLLWP